MEAVVRALGGASRRRQEGDVEAAPEALPDEKKRCRSRFGKVRCQKLLNHAGLHGFIRWTVAESHRW